MKNEFKRKMQKLRNKGFTLAELLIVVAIIAVLVAVSIPVFTGKLEQARTATTEANIRAAKAAAIADFLETAKNDNATKEKTLLSKVSQFFKLKVRAAGEYYQKVGDVRYYHYNASKNQLESYVEGNDFENLTPKKENGVYTGIIVQIKETSGTVLTKPHISGEGSNREPDASSFGGGTGSDSTGNGGNSGGGGNTPVAKEYWNITVEKIGRASGSAEVSASVDKVEKNSGGTVTFTGSGTSFVAWTIEGDYVEKGSIDLNSSTIEITPLSDITACAQFGRLGPGVH